MAFKEVRVTDVFSRELINRMFTKFDTYINTHKLEFPFSMVISEEILVGLDWENTCKILDNLDLKPNKDGISKSLEDYCFANHVTDKYMAGEIISMKEKGAMSSWAMYKQMEIEDATLESIINDSREMSDFTLNMAFEMVISNFVEALEGRNK